MSKDQRWNLFEAIFNESSYGKISIFVTLSILGFTMKGDQLEFSCTKLPCLLIKKPTFDKCYNNTVVQ